MSAVPPPISTYIPASYGSPEFGAPRALVTINGVTFVPTEFEATICNFSASDTATVRLALEGEYQTQVPGLSYKLSSVDFGNQTQNGAAYPIAIYAGYPRDPNPGHYSIKDLVLQFSGIVDKIDWPSYLKDEVELTCRSFAALFYSTKTTAAWNNQTTTSVVNLLCQRHGMTPSINVSNPVTMQTVYNKDFITGTQNIDEWSLLQAMARADNAEVFTRGTTLYYRNRLPAGKAPKYTLDWERDLIDAGVEHSPQFSELVKVDVKTYSPLTRTGTHVTMQGLAGQQPIPGSIRTSSSTATYSPVFGTRISQSSGSNSVTVNGVPLSSGISVGSIQKSGGSFSSGFTHMPNGPSALEYTIHANFTDDASGSALTKADNLARNVWIAISSHLYHLTAHAAVTPETQTLLNQDTMWHLNGPVPSHNLDYYTRKVTQRFHVSQEPEGTSEGWTFEVDGVNVPIVEQKL